MEHRQTYRSHRRVRDDLDLTRAYKDSITRPTREVLHALHGTVVLAVRIVELDAYPLARREGRRPAEPHHPASGRDLDARPQRRVSRCCRHRR